MRISKVTVSNFRGIANAEILLTKHAVLVGDNNTGKSTILEAIDLVLGPDRMNRRPIVDEHDFFGGKYLDSDKKPLPIRVVVVVTDLSDEQTTHFANHIEWWDSAQNKIIDAPPPEQADSPSVTAALRVGFEGKYDEEEDDFSGETFFLSPETEDGTRAPFRSGDKRLCGFLFLRTLRTGTRALSLERGSLLDIILRLKEARLKMWEKVLEQLRAMPVAENPDHELSGILTNIQDSLRNYVPSDWSTSPQMRVSDLTREHLRKTLTVFMATGAKDGAGIPHIAPFQHQGTGTINTLVLAMLSIIAELKQNVIFAMEEPEIAIPPHTQKRIINSIRSKSAQAIFTSHSPYVLEEFEPAQILVLRNQSGSLAYFQAAFPAGIKPKKYREEFRKRFSEALLSRRVLITEGRTEYDSYIATARNLNKLEPEKFKSLEELGVAVFDAETDSQIAIVGEHLKSLGKTTFAVFDKQADAASALIASKVDHAYESPEKGFEALLLAQVPEAALRRHALKIVKDGDWPSHLSQLEPNEQTDSTNLKVALGLYLKSGKGSGAAAELLVNCSVDETPIFIRDTLLKISKVVEPDPAPPPTSDGSNNAANGTGSAASEEVVIEPAEANA